MKPLTKSVPFWVGLIGGIILSLGVGIVDYKMKFEGLCMDCDNDFGFPLKIYQSGSLIHSTQFLLSGLLGNIVIFGFISVCLGMIFHSLWKSRFLK